MEKFLGARSVYCTNFAWAGQLIQKKVQTPCTQERDDMLK